MPRLPIRALLFLAGLTYLLIALTMFTAPHWFFENIGPHAPFNRHYMGDTAAFILPWGVGFMLAVRDPDSWRHVIMLGALASMLHALNHTYDALSHHASLEHWAVGTLPLLGLGLLLTLIYPQSTKPARHL